MKPSRRLSAVLCLLLVFSVACGSLNKTAGGSLLTLKAAYVAADGSRTAYCKPLPEPKPVDLCKKEGKAYQSLFAAYEVLKQGTELLATYEETKTADAKAKLKAFLPVVTSAAIEILKLSIPYVPPSQ